MKQPILFFVVAFAVGTVLALGVRTALHRPNAAHDAAPVPQAPVAKPAPAAHDHGAPAPVAAATKPAPAAEPTPTPVPASVAGQPVNQVCPICGMEVDPDVPTAQWQGKTVGFGCRACPPKFAREPERYGPAALENRVVED